MGGRHTPQRTVTIGQHGSPWTADQARRRAFELLTLVRTGTDPIIERQQARDDAQKAGEARATRLFEVMVERWLNGHVRGRLRSQKDIEGIVKRDLIPAFAGLAIDEITKAKVGNAIEAIGQRSKSASNKAHKWLRQMFNWLIEKGVIEHSPLDRTTRPFAEPSRTRVLSLLEVLIVWNAAAELPPAFRDFYRMLLLVGQRLREVSNLPRSELDLPMAEWLIPPERTKNARPHLIPLSDQACVILLARNAKSPKSQKLVFTTDGEVAISGFSKMKEELDAAISQILETHPEVDQLLGGSFAEWVVHDLRRSLATGCQGLGIPIPVTEAVLNHVSGQRGGIRGVYQLYDYFDEKAEALARWGELIGEALALWERGMFSSIVDLDPVIRAKRLRRARRKASQENRLDVD